MSISKTTLLRSLSSKIRNIEKIRNKTNDPSTTRGLDIALRQLRTVLEINDDVTILDTFYAVGEKVQRIIDREKWQKPLNKKNAQEQKPKKKNEAIAYGKEIYNSIQNYIKRGKKEKTATADAYFDFWENHRQLNEEISSEQRNKTLARYVNTYKKDEGL